ncbi:MAG: RNA polymerase sigma-70 factor [Williamsia sp.]|nr:RNA polymerase sigma-70 factor [Williamsia sp.]
MNPAEKIAALKEGDEAAFGELFHAFHQKIYFYILAKTKSPYLAEEVTQLTFIKLWNNRTRLVESLSVSAQLFQIAKTTCIDLLRKEGNQVKLAVVKQEAPACSSHHSDERLYSRELQSRLDQEVQKMPPMRKTVFEMSRYEAKTYKEIARLLSLSEKTVENHISIALKQLRRVFTLSLLFFIR